MEMKKSLIALALSSSFILTACGSSSGDDAPTTPTPPPAPTNSAPTDISLSSANVAENTASAEVGTLSATDADTGDTFTFTTEDSNFAISGSTLSFAEGVWFDYEKMPSVDVEVTVTDSGNATFTKTFTVDIEDALDYYDFPSKFVDGESAVSYSGQTARHLLINDLNTLINTQIGDLESFDTAGTFTTRDDVMEALLSYFDVPDYDVLSQRPLLTTLSVDTKQSTLNEISSSNKNLVGKIAGNDPVGQHQDWNNGDFAGWGETGSTTPEMLTRTFFSMLADNADSQLQGIVRQDPFGNDITKIYITDDGRDLKQLIQKFLLMAVAYSQAADDYLDADDSEEQKKGLLSDHTDTSNNYTPLEHQFDEGFGYFGAAKNYLSFTDEELAQKAGRDGWQGFNDQDEDGEIDFKSEYNFGQSTNAAKRDRGATVAIDLTADAMNAFLAGRKLLNDTAGTALTEDQMTELLGHRDTALLAWEKSISATVVHYINDTIADLETVGTENLNYADLTKHWSEMKAFALGLQFNRLSPLSKEDFVQVHTLMADKPVLVQADIPAYIANLLAARDILEAAYAFDADNVANW